VSGGKKEGTITGQAPRTRLEFAGFGLHTGDVPGHISVIPEVNGGHVGGECHHHSTQGQVR